jgi:glycerophosphoryl diester phosphodiesterase
MFEKNNKLIIEGHRGFRPLANTSEGFNKCLDMNINGIETDLWLMKDKSILIHHAKTKMGLLKLKNISTKEVKRLFAKDLIKEDLEIYEDYETGKKLIELSELFEIFKSRPEIYLNLELKDCSDELIRTLLKRIQMEKPENKIQFSSFYPHFRDSVKRIAKEIGLERDFSFGFLFLSQWNFESIIPYLSRTFI